MEAVNADEELTAGSCVQFLGRLIEPYLNLWAEYSRSPLVGARNADLG